MRFKIFTLALALTWATFFSLPSFGQNFTNYQIISVNGGKFESNPPFTDYVTIQTTSPETLQTTLQGTIYSQSVQDVIVYDAKYYVAAGDSVVKFDANTHQRLAAARVIGANKLALSGNYLLVSRQYPAVDSFLYILSAENLSFIKAITEISGESAGILCAEGMAFVAVNFGWAGTTGKIAQVDLNNLSFVKEEELGAEATGIYNIYKNGNLLVTVNRTPWGGTSGYLSTYNPLTSQVKHYPVNHVLGSGYGIYKGELFVNLDGNMGTIDLNSYTVANPNLIANPVSAVFGSITSATLDTLNSRIYLNAGDYFSFGQGYVYTTLGDSLGIFSSGISAEAIAIDYRMLEGVVQPLLPEVDIYPNPFVSRLTITSQQAVQSIEIFNLAGQKVYLAEAHSSEALSLNLDFLKEGIYLMKVNYKGGISLTHKVIKR